MSRLDPSRSRANSANTLSDGRGTQQTSPCSIIIQPPTHEASSRSPTTHALLHGPLHNITGKHQKSKLRATHVHHGQVLNILKDISNTGKRTIHNNTGKQESYVNNQHHVTTWTDTVGSPHSSPLRMTAVGPRGQSSGRPLNQWEAFHGRAHRRCGWQPHTDGQLRNNTAERLWPSG